MLQTGLTGRRAVAMAVETLERRSLMAATVMPTGKLLAAPKKPAPVVMGPAVPTAAVTTASKAAAATKGVVPVKSVTVTPAAVGPVPVITEFVASNANGLTDAAGNHPDWIEIQNQGDAPIDLAGWHLSDNASNRAKWTFPSYTLAPGAFMIVYADSATTSGPDTQGRLHTNFSLSADGENLSLSKPDGTVVSEYGSAGALYPKQSADVSYGATSVITSSTNLIGPGAPAKAIAPTTGALDGGLAWTLPGYNDAAWKSGTTGVGYDGGGLVSTANLIARWDAQTTPLTTSGNTTNWTSGVGGYVATTGTLSRRPTVTSINGRTALRFDGVDDRLRVNNSPLATATDFSVAFVFRTTSNGIGGTNGWWSNAGIVDAEVGGTTNDWGLALANNGQIAAGVGNPDNTTIYSQTGYNDGLGHVVVFSKSGATTALSIDGGAPVYGTASPLARSVAAMAIGSLQTDNNFFNGDIGEIRLYNAALSDDAVRSLSTEMARYWGTAVAPGNYTSGIGLDLQTEMAATPTFGGASTAAVRVPFTVSNPSQYNKLALNIKYDDGFVAYLNGTEIARRNAPGGAITYTSTATAPRDDSAALKTESIDVSSYLNLLTAGGSNALAIRALNASAGDSDLVVIPELVGATGVNVTGFMPAPTPGVNNGFGYYGFVQTPTASVKHGYYSSAQSVTLTSATPGATLVYTTDGSEPTLTNGTKVNPANANTAPTTTLNVSSTKVVRMAAFRNGYLDSPVATESYMFLSDILTQPEYTPNGAYWDVGMDSDVVNNTTQTYSVAQALTSIPTISLSLDNADMFGTASGIYTHPLLEGDAWERPVSVEYFDPNSPASQFSINAGIRIQGSFSRNVSRPKKGFKLFFRAEYGQSKLEFPVFGATNPQQVFDHLILRAGHNHSWANEENWGAGDYMRDQFARETQKALTGKSSAGSWVHVYINGQYWGLYNPAEDVDPDWAVANYGGVAENYDIIKPTDAGGVEADDGTTAGYYSLFALVDAAVADGTITSAEYANIASVLDTKGLADYMLSSLYRGDKDSPVLIGSTTDPRNFIALHDRVTPGAKWQFQTQDGEISLDDVNFDRTEVKGNLNPGRLYNQLRASPEFRQLFVDEYNKAFGPNGVLTVAANQARYLGIKAKIDKAIVGESARWGNFKTGNPAIVATRDTHWLNEINWITNTYMPQRDTVIKNLLRADFPEINTLAPTVSVNGVASTGGTVANGSSITLTDLNSPAGTIYYTLDGTDPRSTGGGVAGTAVQYAGAFPLPGARTLNARVLKGGTWSAITTATFTLAPPSLRLSELMYHPTVPAGGTYAKDEYEFIELANTGATAVNLGGMTLNTGADAVVPAGVTLAAGSRGVFVKNPAAFQQRYGTGVQILGTYTDYLSNGGERVTLYDPNSATNVFDVTYSDTWQPSTDNGGYSLVVNNLGPSQTAPTVLGVASAWRASIYAGGSPGADDVALPLVKIAGMTIDNGTAQRSLVRTATLVFDGTLTPASFAPGAVTLTQTTGTISPWTATVSGVSTPAAGQTAVTITFGGASAVAGSLADGRYTLHIDGTKITDSLGRPIDALGTGTAGSAKDYAVARLFGDLDGDLGISINDFNAFSATFGKNHTQASYNAAFDYDGDNGISINDFNEFTTRFGLVI